MYNLPTSLLLNWVFDFSFRCLFQMRLSYCIKKNTQGTPLQFLSNSYVYTQPAISAYSCDLSKSQKFAYKRYVLYLSITSLCGKIT